MPGRIDLLILALFSVVFLAYGQFYAWPQQRAALLANEPGARIRGYRTILLAEWGFTAIVFAQWLRGDRMWTALRLGITTGWRLGASLALVVASGVLFLLQARSIAAIPDERVDAVRARLAPKLCDAILILPRSIVERRWFDALSLTAGFCEELLFRGYAVWVLRPWLGLYGAALASVMLFGLAHSYQGRRGAIRATIVGAVIGALALALGSIIPGMILHAIVDLGGGAVGYGLLRARAKAPAVQTAA